MAGHDKVNDVEYARRVRVVSEYLLQGNSSSDICHNMSLNWNVSERQVRRYISDAKEKIIEDTDEEIEVIKSFHKKTRIDSIRDLKRERDKVIKQYDDLISSLKFMKKEGALSKSDKVSIINEISRALKARASIYARFEARIQHANTDLAKLQGLYVHKHEHTGKDGEQLITSIIIGSSQKSDE